MINKKYDKIMDLLYKRLDEAGMTPKYVERFKSLNIETLGDLFLSTERELRMSKAITGKALYEAKEIMEKYGFIIKEK